MSGLLLAPIIAIAVLLAIAAALALQQGRQRHLVGRVVQPRSADQSLPAILFFTGDSCAICHTAQKPALRTLVDAFGESVTVKEIVWPPSTTSAAPVVNGASSDARYSTA